jgi:pyruvate/2-oxoglutarate dehydrogenase complex dihydrolipoamide acyltransferase (E2) component
LKTPYRDGTTHVIFEPLDFIARLAALVPKPRINLTRFHGVFAPNSQYRARVTPAKRGKGAKPKASAEGQEKTPAERRAAMTWAQRLKRVFGIDIETCRTCGGAVRIMPKALAALAGQALACIEDPVVMPKALRGAGSRADSHPPRREEHVGRSLSLAALPGAATGGLVRLIHG